MKKLITIPNALLVIFACALLSGIVKANDGGYQHVQNGLVSLGCFILAASAVLGYVLIYVNQKSEK